MTTRQTAVVPIGMKEVRRRFEQWRRNRPSRRSAIPDALWSAAVAVARQHGRYATSRALGLDYGALKKRMDAAEEQRAASPTFLELTPSPGACACVIEIEGPRGGTMRVHVNEVTGPDLVALTRVAWNGAA